MAGAAIRPWEFARCLASEHQVILLSCGVCDAEPEGFEILTFPSVEAKKHFVDADILIAQRLTFPLALLAFYHRIKVIIDAYVPGPLELLEHFKGLSAQAREKKVLSEVVNLKMSFHFADGILCASERQRELWIGFLLGQKQIIPSLYDKDPSLKHLLAVVPFGLPDAAPSRLKGVKSMRERFGISPSDKVLLWGGGVWNWFDPLTLIFAMEKVQQKRSDVKLVFMGVTPPDPSLPQTTTAARAISLAKELKLLGKNVFFNDSWIPYSERQQVLIEADIGVSTHFDHLETHFSFRTRLLDYIWAALPIVATKGDVFADLIEKNGVGLCVPEKNAEALAEAILTLVEDSAFYSLAKERLLQMRRQFYWSCVTAPLQEMIQRLAKTPLPKRNGKKIKDLLHFFIAKIQERGISSCLAQYLFGKKKDETQ